MYVTNHGLDTVAMQQVICRAMKQYSDNVTRIERAIDLVLSNKVTHLSSDMYLVASRIDYIVDSTGCPCEDATNRPEYTCKHQWSVLLVQWTQRRQQELAAKPKAAASKRKKVAA